MDMEPAKTIIEYLGGAKIAASIVRKHPSRIYRWAYPSTKREGCGGIIPLKDQRMILEFCHGAEIDLRREDFFCEDRLRSILQRNESKTVKRSNSPDSLPSGEAVVRCEVRQRATATNSGEVVR